MLPPRPLPIGLSAMPSKPLEAFSAALTAEGSEQGVIAGHSPRSSGKVPKASGTERVFLSFFKSYP